MRSRKNKEINSQTGIVKAIEDYGFDLDKASKAINYLILFGALLAGGAQFDELFHENAKKLINSLGMLGVFIVFSGGLVAVILNRSQPKILTEAFIDAQNAELLDSYEDDFSRLHILYVTQGLICENLEGNIPLQEGLISERWMSILRTLIALNLKELMDFSGGEVWSISIYQGTLDDNGNARLKPIASNRTGGSVELATKRIWAEGEGVVGQCFKIKRELIIQDINDKQESSWMHIEAHNDTVANGKNDQDYISFAAVPVMFAEEAWGVVVATSNLRNKFMKDSDGQGDASIEPLRMLAAMVALSVSKKGEADSE